MQLLGMAALDHARGLSSMQQQGTTRQMQWALHQQQQQQQQLLHLGLPRSWVSVAAAAQVQLAAAAARLWVRHCQDHTEGQLQVLLV
jgi:hypothetical protein